MLIKNILVIPTRENYQDVYQRSYRISASHNDLTRLETIFHQCGIDNNGKITETVLANSMPDIVSLNQHTVGKVEVPYGWQTQRLRFMMEVEVPFNGSIKSIYLQGFTEYHDPSLTGHIDPKMFFYINSITEVIRMFDPMGKQIVRPFKTYNVITDLAGGTRYEEIDSYIDGTNDLKLIRPVDIFEDIAIGEMYGDNNIVNTTGTVGHQPNSSHRANNDSLKYFTKTLNEFINSKNTSELSYDMGDMIANNASVNVAEENIMNNEFIYALYKVTGNISSTSFNIEQLLNLDPNIQDKIIMVTGDNRIGYKDNIGLDTEITSSTLQPTPEVMMATTISQSITSILIENMLTSIDLSFTNISGQNVAIVSDVKSYIEGIDITSYVNRLVSKVETVLMPKITHSGMLLVEAHVHADLLGDTTVLISINSQPSEVIRFPTFADSLYSPVISNSVDRAGVFEDFKNVFDSAINCSSDTAIAY